MTTKLPTVPGYRLSRLIGSGATARVYLARPVAEEGRPLPEALKGVRKVALKMLLPPEELRDNPAAADMFANEVRLTLQLRHPNLVRGYEGKGQGEGAYLALEYLPGGALSDLLLPGLPPLPEEQGLKLLRGVAAGLAYMHSQGAIHQDIKPQNIYLCGERALLADFGAAYMQGQGGKAGGSPFYMAPEIYRGEEGRPASDVYSLCVLIYEVLGGKRPFSGSDYGELMYEHLNALPPSLLLTAPDAPRDLARLAQYGLSKAPEARPSVDELLAAFDEALGLPPSNAAAKAPAPPTTAAGEPLGRNGLVDAAAAAASAPTPAEEEIEEATLGQKAGALVSRLNPFKKKD